MGDIARVYGELLWRMLLWTGGLIVLVVAIGVAFAWWMIRVFGPDDGPDDPESDW